MMKQIKHRVLTVGGGSAGHVAPVLAVIDILASRHPDIEVRFWCDRGFLAQSTSLMEQAAAKVKVEPIFAGKLRRYHGASRLATLGDIPTLLRNVADLVFISLGSIQSLIKLLAWRPQVVFCKGGFVCLPVGYAAALLRIPLVIHDSDARPGLTNRLLAGVATFIATGAPLEYYNYPKSKAHYVGIPTRPQYRSYSQAERARTKKDLQLASDAPLLVIIGGGLGAKKINDAAMHAAKELTQHFSVVHISGVRQYDELKKRLPNNLPNYKLIAFISDGLAPLLAAADIVVTRAGASSMAELAAVGASVIMVPATQLADQQKNAQVFVKAGAAVLFDESRLKAHPEALKDEIMGLWTDLSRRQRLSHALSQFARPDAAKKTTDLIEKAAKWQ